MSFLRRAPFIRRRGGVFTPFEQTLDYPNTASNLTVPSGATTLVIKSWGGGGGGGGRITGQAGGGGGGGFIIKTISVSPGTLYSYTVGNGGNRGGVSPNSNGTSGENSTVTVGASYVGGGGGAGNVIASGSGGTTSGNGDSGSEDGTAGVGGAGGNAGGQSYGGGTGGDPPSPPGGGGDGGADSAGVPGAAGRIILSWS